MAYRSRHPSPVARRRRPGLPSGALAGVLAACLACAPGWVSGEESRSTESSPRPHERADAPPRLSLSASASRDVVHDRIAVVLYAEREAPQPAEAQRQVSERLAPVLDRLKSEAGLEVQSAGYRTNPVWQESRVVGWRTHGSIRVSGKPSEAFNRLIGELAGELNVESLEMSLSREARIAAEQELIAQAVAAFRARAQVTAKELGFRGYSIHEVALDGSGPMPPQPIARMAMSRARGDEAAPVPLPATEGKTTVTVTMSGSVTLER